MHDLVIRNARIIDGLGNPSQHGAIAVNGGRISEVGDDVGRGREIVDADASCWPRYCRYPHAL